MKDIIRYSANIFAAWLATLSLISCHYQEIEDAAYPDQTIYMPAAVRGIYDISLVTDTYGVPTPGGPSRFVIDEANNEVHVPLGVYRAGANNDGSFTVAISVNSDTVATLITAGTLAGVEPLPASEYAVPSTLFIGSGSESANFDLSIDLGFLKANPGKVYALAVGISSSERRLNYLYKTTVILIDTKIVN